MSILIWLVVGLIAGFLAKYVVPGEGPGGVIGIWYLGSSARFLAAGSSACSAIPA